MSATPIKGDLVPDVPIAFFSYSREDSEFALRLAADLRAAGANVWIDQLDIGPGQRWDRSVQQALENCPSFLLILSPASVKSDNVLDEVSFALDKQKTLIPILHRDCEIPFRIRRFQHLDFRTDYDRMLRELQKCLHPSGHTAPAPLPADDTRPSPPPVAVPVHHDPPQFTPAGSAAPSAMPPQWQQPATFASEAATSSTFPSWAKFAIPLAVIVVAVIVYMVANSGSSRKTLAVPERPNGSQNQPINAGRSSGAFELVGTGLAHSPTSPPCSLPEQSVTEYSASDPGVWFFFAYRHGDPSDMWTVDWVEPNGYVHKTNTVAHVETGARYCFEMKIAGTPAQNAPGQWKVRLNRNGAEVAEKQFSLSR
jgi:hypothetical protein